MQRSIASLPWSTDSGSMTSFCRARSRMELSQELQRGDYPAFRVLLNWDLTQVNVRSAFSSEGGEKLRNYSQDVGIVLLLLHNR